MIGSCSKTKYAVWVLQTSAAEVEEAKLKLQQAQAAAEAGKPLHNNLAVSSIDNRLIAMSNVLHADLF